MNLALLCDGLRNGAIMQMRNSSILTIPSQMLSPQYLCLGAKKEENVQINK